MSHAPVSFLERLSARWSAHHTLLCVGLDPDPARMPRHLAGRSDAMFEFCRDIVDATADLVCAFKPQAAYFQRHLKMMCEVPKLSGVKALLVSVKFNALQLTVLIRCPRILELGYFFDIHADTMKRVIFQPQVDEGVIVTFTPRGTPDRGAANDPS